MAEIKKEKVIRLTKIEKPMVNARRSVRTITPYSRNAKLKLLPNTSTSDCMISSSFSGIKEIANTSTGANVDCQAETTMQTGNVEDTLPPKSGGLAESEPSSILAGNDVERSTKSNMGLSNGLEDGDRKMAEIKKEKVIRLTKIEKPKVNSRRSVRTITPYSRNAKLELLPNTSTSDCMISSSFSGIKEIANTYTGANVDCQAETTMQTGNVEGTLPQKSGGLAESEPSSILAGNDVERSTKSNMSLSNGLEDGDKKLCETSSTSSTTAKNNPTSTSKNVDCHVETTMQTGIVELTLPLKSVGVPKFNSIRADIDVNRRAESTKSVSNGLKGSDKKLRKTSSTTVKNKNKNRLPVEQSTSKSSLTPASKDILRRAESTMNVSIGSKGGEANNTENINLVNVVRSKGHVKSAVATANTSLYSYEIDLSEMMQHNTINLADFENYVRERFEVNGKINDLAKNVTVELKGLTLIVKSKIYFKKSTLKYHAKKYLKMKKLRHWVKVVGDVNGNSYRLSYCSPN